MGAILRGVIVVDDVVTLIQTETVRLETERLNTFYRQMGEDNAEDVICRAVEELAVRLSHCERMYRQKNLTALRKSARSLIAIAEQVGMMTLATVAGDVTGCIDDKNPVALAATLCRLVRIGEGSVTAVWDLQDLSV